MIFSIYYVYFLYKKIDYFSFWDLYAYYFLLFSMLRRNWHRSRHDDPLFIKLKNNIQKYSYSIVNPSYIDFNSPIIVNQSWFTNLAFPYKFHYTHHKFDLSKAETKIFDYKTIIVNIYPTHEQSQIFKYWFNSFNIMYNQTILFLRQHLPFGNFKFYKQYLGQHIRFSNNVKDIKNIDKDIIKLNNKIQTILNKLNVLYTENKNKKIYDMITKYKMQICDFNGQITDLNIKKDDILKKK